MTIWKFVIDGEGLIEIPCTHRCLSVGEQEGRIVMWAIVDPTTRPVPKQISVIGTGWQGWTMDGINAKRFIGTVQMSDGLVFHVFEDMR